MNEYNRGFIALISVVIIAAIVLVIALGAGTAVFFARSDSLGRENDEEARLLAESCVNLARLQLASSSSYSPTNQAFTIGTDPAGNPEVCVIKSIVKSGEDTTINTYGAYDDSYESVSVTEK